MSLEAVAAQRRRTERRDKFTLRLGRVLVAVVILVAWEASSGTILSEYVLSRPTKIIPEVFVTLTEGLEHVAVTLFEAALGFVIGAIGGIATAVVLFRSPRLEQILSPYLVAFYGIPRVALAPLFLIWFGIGLWSKVVLVFTIVYFIVFLNTIAGLKETDRDLVSVLRSMGARESQIFRKVRFPSATPWIFVGLRLSVPYAIVGAIIGEFLAASKGLGYLIQKASAILDTTGVMATVVVLAVIVLLANDVLDAVEVRVFRWKPSDKTRAGGW